MKSKYLKLIISIALIVALFVGYTCVPAHSEAFALTAGAMGLSGGLAALASTLFGLDYSFSNIGDYTFKDVFIDSIPSDFSLFSLDVVNDPLGFTRLIVNSALSQWLLDNDRDFVSDNSIVSDSSGNLYNFTGDTFRGVDFYYTYSIYHVSSVLDSITISSPGSYSLGAAGFQVNITSVSASNNTIAYTLDGNTLQVFNNANLGSYPVTLKFRLAVNNQHEVFGQLWRNNESYTYNQASSHLTAQTGVTSTVDYSVGTLDTTVGTVVGDESIYIDLGDEYTFSSIEEILQLLNQLVDSGEGIDNIVLSDSPPVPPQPVDTPLGEVPYPDFLDTFGQSVYGKLDAISDGVDTVGRIIDGAGTDVITAVDTAGQSVVEELEVIGGAIDTAGQSVVDSVEESTSILEEAIEAVEAKVDELVDSIADVVEEIMTHPLDLFSAWLDRLPEIPAIKDIFDGIKRHVGIWHYVVEWLGCIGTFLAFFIGLFGDVAYCMVVPIYACVAGAICLAFYKRFAR